MNLTTDGNLDKDVLRLFRHHIFFPALSLAVLEAALLYLILFALVRFEALSYFIPGIQEPYTDVHLQVLGLSVVVGVLTMMSVGLYNRKIFFHMQTVIGRTLVAIPMLFITVSLFIYIFTFITDDSEANYYVIFLIGVILFFPAMMVTRGLFIEVVNLDVFKRRVLVLGVGDLSVKIDKLQRDLPGAHFITHGYVAQTDEEPQEGLAPILSADLLERRHALAAFVERNEVDEIVVATRERRRSGNKVGFGMPVWDLLECKLLGTRVTDFATFWEREAGYIDLDELRPSWLIYSDGFQLNRLRRVVQRVFDVVVSFVFLLLTLPITFGAAIAVKLTSRGPVFYRQERVGLNGRTFYVLKFRSMRTDAEKDGVPRWAAVGDERITMVGYFLRRTRIDEMPQVINVLMGRMSFIGPRPERPYFVNELSKKFPFYGERHRVKPGITGWAQINYSYGASEEDAKVKLAYDLYYVKNGSIFLDFVILMQTVRVILWGEGSR